jgi:HlyD family secretion protein
VKKLLIFLVIVALGLAGLASYTRYSNTHATEDAYTTAKVGFGQMRDIVGVQAVLRPRDVRAIYSMIPGQVVDFMANAGDVVEEDQPLVQLDQRDAQLKRDEAEATVQAAKTTIAAANADLERAEAGRSEAQAVLDALKKMGGSVEKAKAQGAVKYAEAAIKAAQGAVAVAESKSKVAEAHLAASKQGLELTTICAPRLNLAPGKAKNPAGRGVQNDAGGERPKGKFVVLERKVERGQNVDAKQLLFVLVPNLEELEAHALVPESQIGRVARGQEAHFWVDALGEDHKLPAKVSEIRPSPAGGQPGAVYYEVLLSVKNPKNAKTGEWQLRAGMTAQVEIVDRTHEGVWKLPVNARGFTLDDHHQTPQAKQQAAQAEQRLDMSVWSKIWILRDKKPWPVFVRLNGATSAGDTGIKDAEYYEILEWDGETMPAGLNPKDEATYPEVIIGAPPKNGGFFEFKPIKF